MSTEKPKNSGDGKADVTAAAEVLNASELFWQPYRAMSRMLLQTHQNLAAYMAVNRALAEEMQSILRRAQDMTMEMSEKTIRNAERPAAPGAHRLAIPAPEMEELYDFAIHSVRELGGAAVAAQIHSLEALRAHARAAASVADEAKR